MTESRGSLNLTHACMHGHTLTILCIDFNIIYGFYYICFELIQLTNPTAHHCQSSPTACLAVHIKQWLVGGAAPSSQLQKDGHQDLVW